MESYKITICGNNIRDKHTHYEATVSFGHETATVIIGGHIAEDFLRRYGYAITRCPSFQATIPLARNSELVQECQDPYKSPTYRIGSIQSIDEIVVR